MVLGPPGLQMGACSGAEGGPLLTSEVPKQPAGDYED